MSNVTTKTLLRDGSGTNEGGRGSKSRLAVMQLTKLTARPHVHTPSSSFTETNIDFSDNDSWKNRAGESDNAANRTVSAKEPDHGEATTTTTVPTSSFTFIQRLRHADSRTRHAALVIVLAPLSEGKSAGAAVSIFLMQAVHERVMDNDLECAQTAAECLGLYVTHQKHRQTTASWTALLLNWIGRCVQEIQSTQQDSVTTTTTTTTTTASSSSSSSVSMKRWWALTAKCVQALCGLIESNTLALERLTAPTPDGKNPVTVLGRLVGHGTYVAPQNPISGGTTQSC